MGMILGKKTRTHAACETSIHSTHSNKLPCHSAMTHPIIISTVRHYPGSVAMASAPSEVASFEGGSLGNVSFLVRSFPITDGMISSWQKSINLSTRIYVKLSAVVQMDRIAAHSCSFYPLVLYDLRYCKHKLRERGVNF